MTRKESVDRSSYRSYLLAVKSVGIKLLKNNLSKYLKLVRGGETILVMDRHEVIAEIRRPQTAAAADRLRALLEEEARLGSITLAGVTGVPPSLDELAALPRPKTPVDTQALLDAIRAD